jgi:hypothetical protein
MDHLISKPLPNDGLLRMAEYIVMVSVFSVVVVAVLRMLGIVG